MTTIHARFLETAQAHRSRPAIVARGGATTYGELLDESLAVARFLHGRRVGRGDRVGVCMEKSSACFAVLLGTMLAGAAVVPLELSTPPARLGSIMANADVSALFLTHSVRLDVAALAALPNVRALVFHDGAPKDLPSIGCTWDAAVGDGSAPMSAFDAPSSAPTDPAYILYTSGSTGQPKGVVLSHAAALAFIDWSAAAVGPTAEHRVSSHASLGFDLSVFDVYTTLLGGASCHPVPEMQRGAVPFLARFIETNAIDVWYSVPSIAARIAEHCLKQATTLPSIRHLVVAGEVFPTRALDALRQAFPNARIHNWYGPTETNVVTFHEVTTADDGTRPMPIGRACPFANVRVLGEDLREVPAGEKGVLYAGGRSLMNEYWADSEKTARSMIEIAGERFYRTGDVVFADAASVLHYVGRADDMVKILGYRVEPGEVESAVRDEAGTEDAAVVAVEQGGELVLVAFVAKDVSPDELSKGLKRRLPTYMLPREIVLVEDMPRNERGKIDRAALVQRVRCR